MHPIEDINIKNIVTQFIKYEPNTEEGVIALLAYTLLRDKNLHSDIKELLDELDIGNISADTNIGEEELEQLVKSFEKRREFSLVVGADLYRSSRADSIAKYIALLERYFNFNLIVIPPATNGLGVSLICDLDDEVEGYTIGYNVERVTYTSLSCFKGGWEEFKEFWPFFLISSREGNLTEHSIRIKKSWWPFNWLGSRLMGGIIF